MPSKIAVIGTGSWGTAAAGLVAEGADQVVLWARSPEVAEAINQTHRNPRHLTGYRLPPNVSATHDPAQAVADAQALVVAVPSNHLRRVLAGFAPQVGPALPILVLTKGIEPATHLLMTEVVSDVLGHPERVAALTGPNHAEEVCLHMVSAAVVGAQDDAVASLFQRLFLSTNFRVYKTDDLRGIEVCAAIKNVIAIACGVCGGCGYGDNTMAVIMTRGLAEMSRVVVTLGGDPLTCMGLAGMGDLVVTCTSDHSRNRTFGTALARGASLASYESATHMVVEGARAAVSIHELSQERGIETPLTDAVHAILYEGTNIEEAARTLLARTPDEEFYGLDQRARTDS